MINIIVAESHPVVRHGLNRTLGATGGFSIIAEVDTMEGLWENIGSPRADVLICETALFKRRTFETLQRIKQRRPYIPIVVFSRYVDASYVVESFRGGAMIETYPLEKAAEGYARMISGKAQFRVVLTM